MNAMPNHMPSRVPTDVVGSTCVCAYMCTNRRRTHVEIVTAMPLSGHWRKIQGGMKGLDCGGGG